MSERKQSKPRASLSYVQVIKVWDWMKESKPEIETEPRVTIAQMATAALGFEVSPASVTQLADDNGWEKPRDNRRAVTEGALLQRTMARIGRLEVILGETLELLRLNPETLKVAEKLLAELKAPAQSSPSDDPPPAAPEKTVQPPLPGTLEDPP